VIVAAAGAGVANPFRGEKLESVYPQSYPQVLVVGASKSLEELDPAANFGDPLDVIVTGQASDEFGSSYGAATVSGSVAALLARYPRATPDQIRAAVRATAAQPDHPIPAVRPVVELMERVAFGAFRREKFLEVGWRVFRPRTVTWVFGYPRGDLDVELGLSADATKVVPGWSCSSGQADGSLVVLHESVLPKARARVLLAANGGSDAAAVARRADVLARCRLSVAVTFAAGSSEKLEIPLLGKK
jgi:hypothetical protein